MTGRYECAPYVVSTRGLPQGVEGYQARFQNCRRYDISHKGGQPDSFIISFFSPDPIGTAQLVLSHWAPGVLTPTLQSRRPVVVIWSSWAPWLNPHLFQRLCPWTKGTPNEIWEWLIAERSD